MFYYESLNDYLFLFLEQYLKALSPAGISEQLDRNSYTGKFDPILLYPRDQSF